jgi:hypothetical protein
VDAATRRRRRCCHAGCTRYSSRNFGDTERHDAKLKVQASIHGEEVRVNGKQIDDLQSVIAMLREADLGVPLQFVNMKSLSRAAAVTPACDFADPCCGPGPVKPHPLAG